MFYAQHTVVYCPSPSCRLHHGGGVVVRCGLVILDSNLNSCASGIVRVQITIGEIEAAASPSGVHTSISGGMLFLELSSSMVLPS